MSADWSLPVTSHFEFPAFQVHVPWNDQLSTCSGTHLELAPVVGGGRNMAYNSHFLVPVSKRSVATKITLGESFAFCEPDPVSYVPA
jgi:hypothetical protein